MIFFTSDLHIGHDRDFLYEPRGFTNIIDHDTALIKNWNEVVSSEDTVYILGDLCLGSNENEWDRVFYNLNGNIKFIHGNHDTDKRIDRYIDLYGMEDLGYANMYKYSKSKRFYLSHYPTHVSNFDDGKKYPMICLFGHTHQQTPFFNNDPYMYNVGLDAHNMYPVSIEDVIMDIEIYKQKLIKEK